MTKRYEATGPLAVGGDEIKHFDAGDEVPGAEDFDNFDDLITGHRLREVTTTRKAPAKKAAAAEDEAAGAAPKKVAAKRSGSRSRTSS